MARYWVLAIILALFMRGCLSGQVRNGDVSVDYANAGSMTRLSFAFLLETKLYATDYIKVSLPFPLHAQLTAAVPGIEGLSSPFGVVVTYQYMDDAQNVLPQSLPCRVLTDSISSSNYYVQFYSQQMAVMPIPANQWFLLTMQLRSPQALQFQIANRFLQIQLYTVSSVWANAVVYDDNLAFNYLQLSSAPSGLIGLTITPFNNKPGVEMLIESQYSVYLDILLNLPSYFFSQTIVLHLYFTQPGMFTWAGVCSSVTKNTSPLIAMLDPSLYSCSIDFANNIVSLLLSPSALTGQSSYRLSVGLINPTISVSNVSVVVKAVQYFGSTIIGYGQAGGLSTNQIYVKQQQILVAWGLQPSPTLPFPALVIRGNQANPTYKPYNSFQLKFALSQTTPFAHELKIIINIPSYASAYVLPSSLTSDLPAYLNKQVLCLEEYGDSGSLRQIGCTGVGQLSTTKVYTVGWKMFFPYDSSSPDLNCSKFGLLTILSATIIGTNHTSFLLGRGDSFLSSLGSNNSNYLLIGRNYTYLNYLLSFPSAKLVLITTDFQELVSKPENVYFTNRPSNYSLDQFGSVYVANHTLALLTYLSLFSDIYIAAFVPRTTDIVCGYNPVPLVAASSPKNTLSIGTANTKDWTDFATNSFPLVSSTPVPSSNVPGSSLLASSTQQSLIFSLKAAYSEVTSFSSSAGTAITNNWGFLIMTNPKLTFGSSFTLAETILSGLTASANTVLNSSAVNQYSLIKLQGSTSNNLQTYFQVVSSKQSIGFYPVTLNSFSSIYYDTNNMDFLIACVDGINGPRSQMRFNGYFLINGFSLSPPLGTLNHGFVNYESTTPMDGSQVPTLLRVKGTFAGISTFDSLVLFFDTLTPFYSNPATGEIYCANTGSNSPCAFYPGIAITTGNEKYNYNLLSRIYVPLSSPSTLFNVFIPIIFVTAATSYLYVGYQTTVSGHKSLQYMEPLSSISVTQTASPNGVYGPSVATSTVGQNVPNLKIVVNSPMDIGTNNGNSIGGAYSFFSYWDYFQNTMVSGWETYGQCFPIKYLYYKTNYATYTVPSKFIAAYRRITGIVCTTDLSGNIIAAQLNLLTGHLPYRWGTVTRGYNAVSLPAGGLLYLVPNLVNIGTPIAVSGITFPVAGPSMANAVASWMFPLPVPLDFSVQIVISANPTTTSLPYSFTGTCAVSYLGRLSPISCSFTSSSSSISYFLTISQPGLLLTNSSFSIIHYGLSTGNTFSSVTTTISCYSLLNSQTPGSNDLIYVAASEAIPVSSPGYMGPSSLSLGSYSSWTGSRAVTTYFNFSFSLVSKGLYPTYRVRIDLGQWASDNTASLVNPYCQVYQYDTQGSQTLSHDWIAIDSSAGLHVLDLWPNCPLSSSNLTYTVKCNNFLSTSSQLPAALSAQIGNISGSFNAYLQASPGVTLPVLASLSIIPCTINLSKKFSTPSLSMNMIFTISSPGVTQDSILYLTFPNTYASGLGSDIKCYTALYVYCQASGRNLVVQFMGTYPQGFSYDVKVTGVVMPIVFSPGTFVYVFDTDTDPNAVQATGTFTDTITKQSLLPITSILIFSLSLSSTYLRDYGITLSLSFYLDGSLPPIGLGQSLMLLFPPIYSDIMRFIQPSCSLTILGNTLQNYLASCSVDGLRVVMPLQTSLALGSTYLLSLQGLINPSNPSSNVHKYSLEITDSSNGQLLGKSFSPNCNYLMPIFQVNPNPSSSLNYYTQDGLISNIYSSANIQSPPFYISPSSDLAISSYPRNAYLDPLSSLQSLPTNIILPAGANPFPVRLGASLSGVNYFYFSKNGDGNFYSRLPPFTLLVSANKNTLLSFVYTTLSLPIAAAGSNYSLVVTLPPAIATISQVNLTLSVPSTSGLALCNGFNKISFYPNKLTAAVCLQLVTQSLWIIGSTTSVLFSPADRTYASGASVILKAVNSGSLPLLKSSFIAASVNSLSFKVSCSQYGKLAYHLSRSFSYNSTACSLSSSQIRYWLAQPSTDSLRASEVYYDCQDLFGILNMDANVYIILKLPMLLSSTSYDLYAYCEDQFGSQSPSVVLPVSTLSNGGLVSRMEFTFSAPLGVMHKIKLVCQLSIYFGVDYQRVSTYDGYYCSELLGSRLLLAKDMTDMVDTKSIIQSAEGKRQLSASPSAVRLLSEFPNMTTIYFGINNKNGKDDSFGKILSESNQLLLLNNIDGNITDIPQLLSYSLAAPSYVGPNSFDLSAFSLGVGPTYLYITGLAMPHNGLIYAVLGDSNIWNKAPLVSEIKSRSGPGGLLPVASRVLTYVKTSAASGSLSFTGLDPDFTYTLYLLASDDNPFDTANLGEIKSYKIVLEMAYESLCTILALLFLFTLFV